MLLYILKVVLEGTKAILDSIHKLPLSKLECVSRIFSSLVIILLVLTLLVVLISVLW